MVATEPEVPSTGPNLWDVAAHATPAEQDWCALIRVEQVDATLRFPRQPRSFSSALPRTDLTSLRLSACRVYQQRKNANEGKGDIVFNQLAYKPFCPCMPVCKEKCERAQFMWLKVFLTSLRVAVHPYSLTFA